MPSLSFSRWRLVLLGAALAALTAGCDNDCDFTADRCNGNAIESCGEGPDQMSHRRIVRTECAAPNGVCVDAQSSVACVADAKVACGTSEAPRCQDGTVVSCSSTGYESIEVCDPAFSVCHENTDQTAACVYAPGLTCSDSYRHHCEGNLVLSCSNQHLVIAQNCTAESERPTCSDDGTDAYCK